MSDDGTPTERFDATGDVPTRKLDAAQADSPTERFEAPTAAPAPAADQRSRRPVIILAVVGGLLLIALIVVLVLLLTRGGTPSALPTGTPSATPTATGTPTPTATPTPTPTPTETVAPPPPSTAAVVDSFTINPTSASCASGDPVITLQWSTSNANNVFFGVDTGTNDAQQSPFFADSLPASGNSTNDFPDGYRPFTYTCGNGSHTYVITAVGSDGSKDSVIVKVTG